MLCIFTQMLRKRMHDLHACLTCLTRPRAWCTVGRQVMQSVKKRCSGHAPFAVAAAAFAPVVRQHSQKKRAADWVQQNTLTFYIRVNLWLLKYLKYVWVRFEYYGAFRFFGGVMWQFTNHNPCEIYECRTSYLLLFEWIKYLCAYHKLKAHISVSVNNLQRA